MLRPQKNRIYKLLIKFGSVGWEQRIRKDDKVDENTKGDEIAFKNIIEQKEPFFNIIKYGKSNCTKHT